MKINHIIKLLILGGLALLMSFYKLPVDYRDQHVGNYLCNRSCQVVNDNKTGLEIRYDTITVSITKDVSDSVLNVRIGQRNLKVKLINSKFSADRREGIWAGRFVGDSLKLSTSIGKVSNVCSYKGKKQV